ncbi:MAG: aldolase [Planctomycetes bacterium]|nr:aldolase [Planctomycetota bacterium]
MQPGFRTLKERLAQGEIVRVLSLGTIASPKIVEIAGRVGGYHGVWIDQEHSAVPHHELELILMACRAAGLDAFARVAPTDYATVMRPLETGAGVMIAQVRSVELVEQAVSWAKYPPWGVRGVFLGNYEGGYGTVPAAQHVEASNRDRLVIIQIETPEAVEAVERIARVRGVDHLFVGPSDLACTLGVPGQILHPKCVAALERVAAAAKAAGKSWGVLSRDPAHLKRCRDLGSQLFSIASETDLLHRGFQATRALFPELF